MEAFRTENDSLVLLSVLSIGYLESPEVGVRTDKAWRPSFELF